MPATIPEKRPTVRGVGTEVKPTRSRAPARTLPLVAIGTALVLATYVTPIASTPATVAALGAGSGGQAWILSSMSLGLAAALLPIGAVGDARGRRLVYLAGLVLLGLGSLTCGVAGDPGLFVAARVVQGIGGAAVLACGLAVLAHAYADPAGRSHATGVWGASVGVGISVGAVLAAALGDLGTGWRETYFVVGVLALVLVLPSRTGLAESVAEQPRRLDLGGVLVIVGTMTLLVTGLTEARSGISATVVVLLAAAVVLVVVFGVVELRVRQPMIEPHLAGTPGFLAANVAALAVGLGIIAMSSTVPTYVQVGLGESLWVSIVPALVWSVTGVFTSLLVRRFRSAWSGQHQVAAALVVVALGELLALGTGPGSTVWRLVPAFFVAGLASGVLNAVMGREAVANVPPDRAAMASGSNNTARYLGAACGITVFSVTTVHAGWNTAVLYAVSASLAGAAVCAWDGTRKKQS